jgi:hypothetical protein
MAQAEHPDAVLHPLSVERGQHVLSSGRWMQHLVRIATLYPPIVPAVLRQPSARHVSMLTTAATRGAGGRTH